MALPVTVRCVTVCDEEILSAPDWPANRLNHHAKLKAERCPGWHVFLMSLPRWLEQPMRAMMLTTVFGLAVTVATPVFAQDAVREFVFAERAAPDLNHYVGSTLFGFWYANLGVVTAANAETGVIALTGRHAEFALISSSMLTDAGGVLRAPDLTPGDIKVALDAQLANRAAILAAPQIIVIEPPAG
jgi:hypothetical protein